MDGKTHKQPTWPTFGSWNWECQVCLSMSCKKYNENYHWESRKHCSNKLTWRQHRYVNTRKVWSNTGRNTLQSRARSPQCRCLSTERVFFPLKAARSTAFLLKAQPTSPEIGISYNKWSFQVTRGFWTLNRLNRNWMIKQKLSCGVTATKREKSSKPPTLLLNLTSASRHHKSSGKFVQGRCALPPGNFPANTWSPEGL